MRASYYGTLGVFLGCSDGDVRGAWNVLKQAKHPDYLMHQPNFDEPKARDAFCELTEAYEQLKSIPGRKAHKQWMVFFAEECKACHCRGSHVSLKGNRQICVSCNGAGYVDKQQ